MENSKRAVDLQRFQYYNRVFTLQGRQFPAKSVTIGSKRTAKLDLRYLRLYRSFFGVSE